MDRTQYVKIYTDQPEDYRWGLLDDTAKAVWVEALCWAKREHTRGALPDVRNLAYRLRRNGQEAQVLQSLQQLAHPDVGWIERTDTGWQIAGWDIWQRDALTPAERSRLYHGKQKQRPATTRDDKPSRTVADAPIATAATLQETGDRRQETRDITTKKEEKTHEMSDLPSDAPPVEVVEAELVVDASDKVPIAQIVEAYHAACCPPMPRVAKLTDARRQYIRARWHEDKARQSAGWWQEYWAYCAESPFLRGETEGRNGQPPFLGSLEWLTKPGNMVKVLEGQYHREAKPGGYFAGVAMHNAETLRKYREGNNGQG